MMGRYTSVGIDHDQAKAMRLVALESVARRLRALFDDEILASSMIDATVTPGYDALSCVELSVTVDRRLWGSDAEFRMVVKAIEHGVKMEWLHVEEGDSASADGDLYVEQSWLVRLTDRGVRVLYPVVKT